MKESMKRKPGCLIAVVAVFYVLTAGYVYLVRDVRFIDDHGLGAVPAPMAEEQNAFPLLCEATNDLVPPPDWVREFVVDGTNWNNQEAATLIVSNAAVFAKVDKALEKESYQSTIIRSMQDPIPWLSPFRQMGRLLKVKSEWHLRQGDTKEAAEIALKMIRMGYLIQAKNSSLIELLVGDAIKNYGVDQILRSAKTMDNSKDILSYAQELDHYVGRGVGLSSAMPGEYRLSSACIDLAASGDVEAWIQSIAVTSGEFDPPPASLFKKAIKSVKKMLYRNGIKLILNKNRTKQEFADFLFEIGKGSGLSLQDARTKPEFQSLKTQENQKWTTVYLKKNGGGMVIKRLMLPSLEMILERMSKHDFQISAVRVSMIILAYKLDHSDLPQSLQALVPDYLPSIPSDPYDGAPIRYNDETRVVYAVGPDFKDDGGAIEKGEDGDAKDVGIRVGE